jgi:hypothetical protein
VCKALKIQIILEEIISQAPYGGVTIIVFLSYLVIVQFSFVSVDSAFSPSFSRVSFTAIK